MRIQILSKSGAHLLGFAKNKLRQLAQMRLNINLHVMNKTFYVDEYLVYIETADWGDKIRISGGGFFNILFSDGVVSWLYGWKEDNLIEAGNATAPLTQAFLYHIDGVSERNKIKNRSVKALSEGFTPYQAAEMFPRHNAIATRRGNNFHIETAKKNIILTATIEDVTGAWEDVITNHYIYIGGHSTVNSAWNRMNTRELTLINTTDPNTSFPFAWKWTPRIWCPDLANSLYLLQGMYYGALTRHWGPYDEIKAKFGCILKHREGSKHFMGYAEVFTEAIGSRDPGPDPDENEGPHFKAFFQNMMWEAPKDYNTHINLNRLTISHSYWASTPRESFAIYYDNILTGSFDTLDWWSTFDEEAPLENIYGDTYGVMGIICVSTTGDYVLHKVKSIPTKYGLAFLPYQLHQGTNYHSHSLSYDGSIVAIFIGEGVVSDVYIYDLVNAEEIRSSSSSLQAENAITSGQIIPREGEEAKKIIPLEYEYFSVEAERPEVRLPEVSPSFFSIGHPWPSYMGHVATGWRVDVDNGEGHGYMWVDECWQKTSYNWRSGDPENPPDPALLGYLVGFNIDKEIPAMSFAAYGKKTDDGLEPAGEGGVIGRDPISIAGQDMFGCLFATRNAASPLEWSGDVSQSGCAFSDGPQDVAPAPGCLDNGEGFPIGRVRLKDACGERAEPKDYVFSKLSMLGADEVEVGDFYLGGGGTYPYTYTFSHGSIDSETGEILSITGCGDPGDPAIGTVTAIDACGRSASIDARLPGGFWEYVEGSEWRDPVDDTCLSSFEFRAFSYIYSGGFRRRYEICTHQGNPYTPGTPGCQDGVVYCCEYCTAEELVPGGTSFFSSSSEQERRMVTGIRDYIWVCP